MSIPADDLLTLHRRLLSGDRTAPNDVARAALEPLVERLRGEYRVADESVLYEAAIDAILAYCANPASWTRPRRPGSREAAAPVATSDVIFRFLHLVAWRSARAQLRSQKRFTRRGKRYLDRAAPAAVELSDPAAKMVQAEEEAELRRRRALVLAVLEDETDRQMMELRLSGDRAHGPYARILGITELPIAEQRKVVNRHKDRIDKIVKRALQRRQTVDTPARQERE